MGAADNFEIKPRVWTTFRISINPEKSIQVYSSNGSSRNKKKIIDVDEIDIGRGQVGLATSGTDQAFFDNIFIEAFDPNEGKPVSNYFENPDFAVCLNDNTPE